AGLRIRIHDKSDLRLDETVQKAAGGLAAGIVTARQAFADVRDAWTLTGPESLVVQEGSLQSIRSELLRKNSESAAGDVLGQIGDELKTKLGLTSAEIERLKSAKPSRDGALAEHAKRFATEGARKIQEAENVRAATASRLLAAIDGLVADAASERWNA